MKRETELALIPSLKRGDELAFDTIYEAHRAKIFSFLLRLGHDRNLAEELLEETWLRLVTRAHTLADDSRILPWLLTVARNLYLSYRRSRQMDTNRMQELRHLGSAQGNDMTPFEMTAGHELERNIEQALAALPMSYREVILLVAFEGLTPSEAASVCEVSPETMRQRLSRARANLARILEDKGVVLKTGKTGKNEKTGKTSKTNKKARLNA